MLRNNLPAVPVTVVQEQATEFGEVDSTRIERGERQLEVVFVAIDAPGCRILHSQRFPDLLLQVVAGASMRRALQDEAGERGVIAAVAHALAGRFDDR